MGRPTSANRYQALQIRNKRLPESKKSDLFLVLRRYRWVAHSYIDAHYSAMSRHVIYQTSAYLSQHTLSFHWTETSFEIFSQLYYRYS
jgi:hypothetical protein